MVGYYTNEELLEMGFASVGENVRISRTATLYNCHRITIGSNVRIDNFCTIALSGQATLKIGNYVHISAYNFFNGAADLTIEDFVTTAPFVSIFTSTDDYSGSFLTGGVVPRHLIGTISASVLVKSHCIIGTHSSLMPGVMLDTATSVGAYSMVKKNTDPFTVVAGVPASVIRKRKKDLLSLVKELEK